LVWTELAIQDRLQLYEFIAQENPYAAIACDHEISQQLVLLSDFPEMGRPGRVEGTRELVIQRTPFLIPYQVQERKIRLLRVLHGAQMWPENF
jgi:toxin ParE1/3/4